MAAAGQTGQHEGLLNARRQLGLAHDPRLMIDPLGGSVAALFWAMIALIGRNRGFSAVFCRCLSLPQLIYGPCSMPLF